MSRTQKKRTVLSQNWKKYHNVAKLFDDKFFVWHFVAGFFGLMLWKYIWVVCCMTELFECFIFKSQCSWTWQVSAGLPHITVFNATTENYFRLLYIFPTNSQLLFDVPTKILIMENQPKHTHRNMWEKFHNVNIFKAISLFMGTIYEIVGSAYGF